jgi:hypothetical protein
MLPGVLGGDGGGEVRGVSVVGFERGNLLFLDCAWNFDETAYHSTKFLIGLHVADIIGPQLHFGLSDWLQWCRQQG